MLQSQNSRDPRLKAELRVNVPISQGKSAGARRVQEYLWLNGVKTGIDGDWGSSTQTAVDQYCDANGLQRTNSIDQGLMDRLAQPLLRAADRMQAHSSLGDTIVAFAKQQIAEHPIEIGGPNMGPWVRLYMDGNQGKDWLWCAGFATYIVRYSAALHGMKSPVPTTFSCDTLAASAKSSKIFRKKGSVGSIPAGSVFLVPSKSNSNDWIHTGIVLDHSNGSVITAEGNTDHGGSSNGYEATTRLRNAANVDIILI